MTRGVSLLLKLLNSRISSDQEAPTKTEWMAILQTSASTTATLLTGSVNRRFSVYPDGFTGVFRNCVLQIRYPFGLGIIVAEAL